MSEDLDKEFNINYVYTGITQLESYGFELRGISSFSYLFMLSVF